MVEALWWLGWDGVAQVSALLGVYLVLALATTVHVLLTKESSRAAAGWMGLVWLSPVLGSVLYTVFGVNRVHRKAVKLRRPRRRAWGQRQDTAVGSTLGGLRQAVAR
ncbi:MAG: PLDc N-terminal domain-containing protein, partial [Myxococcales bacterium]|nr:PLDc N-terminal domain-containing protein [Myxococcales bacterium]